MLDRIRNKSLHLIKKSIDHYEKRISTKPFIKKSLSKPLRVAVIGSGKAASYHLKVLQQIGGVDITTIVNTSSAPKELIKSYNIKNYFNDINVAISSNLFDVAIVAVTAKAIIPITEKLIDANIPCLSEKPFGLNYEESLRLSDKINNKNIFCAVGYNRRNYSSVIKAKNFIESNGEPYFISVDAPEDIQKLFLANSDVADIKNRIILNTSHAIDLMMYFMGNAVSINDFSTNLTFNDIKADYVKTIQFEGIKRGIFTSHWRSPGEWTLKLYGRSYQLIINLTQNTLTIQRGKNSQTLSPTIEDQLFKSGVYLQNYHFLESINQKSLSDNLIRTTEATESLRLSEKIQTGGIRP